ncbi:TPA: hypothetical protein ACK21W_001769 [Yersinia enterocolitica]|nr:hypothetical protein [Yersinia enterocolitica]
MKTTDILKMKKDLEQILGIEVWNPTEVQLSNIWSKLANLPSGASETDILKIVNSVYHEPLIVSCMEGLDTSVALMALFKIKEMQDNIKSVEKQNATQNKPTAGKS